MNTELHVTAPPVINVHLVREDYLAASNTFRIFYEIFLAISTGLGGVILSIPDPTKLHYIFLAVTSLSSITFIILSRVYSRRAKSG